VRVGARTVVDGVLRRTPAQAVFHWRASRSLAVLAYHEIRDPERFTVQLDHVRRVTNPVTLGSVVRAAAGGPGLPPRAVLLTFDDGHRDVLEVAMPMLRERGLPAAAFVVAGLVGTDTPHWWTEVKELVQGGGNARHVEGLTPDDTVRALKRVSDDVRLGTIADLQRSSGQRARPVAQLTADDLRALESAGVAVGNHSLSHPCLSRCHDEKIRNELERSHEIFTAELGHEPEAFAYPDGDRDERVTNAVEHIGYRAAFLFDHRLSVSKPPDPLNISRLRMDADAGFDRFRIIVSGLHPSIHRLRRLR
jgi:peptidoglycan/xylan/chitin deacetylase (PgdA/CDA1 family)